MYQRPSEDDIQKWQREFSKDRLYQNLFDALAHVCCQIRSMTPQEIWNIALQYCSEIEQSENPLFAIDALQNMIFLQMSNYSVEDAERISFLVRFVILYQLTRKQKSLENHPYEQFCIALIRQLETNPLFNQLIPMVTEKNDRYEGIYGGELDAYDYFKDTQLKTPLKSKDDNLISDGEVLLELDKHRELFAEAMKQAQDTWYSKDTHVKTIKNIYDWYGVFRMGSDIGIFNTFEDFSALMQGDGWKHKPSTIQNFQNYIQHIEKDSLYPNWTFKRKGSEKFCRKFQHIADVVYVIYKQKCLNENLKPYGEVV